MHYGFEPIFDKNSKILILGSFPSVISRKNQFYYANPQNRFWKMLFQIFDEPIDPSIDQKKAFLSAHHIALWDIVQSCEIKGSQDSKIQNTSVVDLSIILDYAPIQLILCNGKKAYEIYQKNYSNSIPCVCLPSTSPANTRFTMELWKEQFVK